MLSRKKNKTKLIFTFEDVKEGDKEGDKEGFYLSSDVEGELRAEYIISAYEFIEKQLKKAGILDKGYGKNRRG